MYILIFEVAKQWYLLSHTGLVLARSKQYKRRLDAVRVEKQVAKRLGIEVKVY